MRRIGALTYHGSLLKQHFYGLLGEPGDGISSTVHELVHALEAASLKERVPGEGSRLASEF